MDDEVEMTLLVACSVCQELIRWIPCPTGGWWQHEMHPEDEHDAAPMGDPAVESMLTRLLDDLS